MLKIDKDLIKMLIYDKIVRHRCHEHGERDATTISVKDADLLDNSGFF